jgi:hypothetical protein
MKNFMADYVAGKGTTALGIIGTVLGSIGTAGTNGGILGLGSNNGMGMCSENMPVNRYELSQQRELANKDMEIAYLRSQGETDKKLLEVYKYFDGELKEMRQSQCDRWAGQGIINAKFESAVDVMGSQIGSINTTISNITKTVVPNSAICPGWGNICVQTIPCTTATVDSGTGA